MATAVEPSSAPSTPGQPLSLPIASLLGAVYVSASLAIIFYLLPVMWAESLTPQFKENNLVDWITWLPALVVVIVGLLMFGRKIAGDAAPRGMHGGIFLMISAGITIFFFARAFAMNIEGVPGMVIGAAVALGLAYLAVRFFTGKSGERWMVLLEEQGWFSTRQYKRSLGVKVRRITILGVLVVGGSGAWSLYSNGLLPEKWTLAMPFGMQPAQLMSGAKLALPALIVGVTLWVAFRAVNVPDFAEFLVATEAEMNKVSWSTRKRLAQDTVVVLITTLLMTLFLLAVDLFWGWLLSRHTVGVLPPRATNQDQSNPIKEQKW